jgi:flagellar hook-associated protein 3 FlgL
VVNGVGKDIFGGVYTAIGASNASVALFNGSDSANLMETVGKLIGYLETNNQDGIEAAVANLTTSQNQVLEVAASVGGRENRVTSAENMVTTLKDNATTTLSSVEDADITELMTKLAQQELAYQAVLKSSSMVMDLSLLNYV